MTLNVVRFILFIGTIIVILLFAGRISNQLTNNHLTSNVSPNALKVPNCGSCNLYPSSTHFALQFSNFLVSDNKEFINLLFETRFKDFQNHISCLRKDTRHLKLKLMEPLIGQNDELFQLNQFITHINGIEHFTFKDIKKKDWEKVTNYIKILKHFRINNKQLTKDQIKVLKNIEYKIFEFGKKLYKIGCKICIKSMTQKCNQLIKYPKEIIDYFISIQFGINSQNTNDLQIPIKKSIQLFNSKQIYHFIKQNSDKELERKFTSFPRSYPLESNHVIIKVNFEQFYNNVIIPIQKIIKILFNNQIIITTHSTFDRSLNPFIINYNSNSININLANLFLFEGYNKDSHSVAVVNLFSSDIDDMIKNCSKNDYKSSVNIIQYFYSSFIYQITDYILLSNDFQINKIKKDLMSNVAKMGLTKNLHLIPLFIQSIFPSFCTECETDFAN